MVSTTGTNTTQGPVAPDTGRLLTYGVAFIGLMGSLFGATGLLGLLLAETVFSSRNVISAGDARQQASYYLAALLVCTPLWLSFWKLAQRRMERVPEERNALDRRLFFALVFVVTSVTALFALHTLLRVLLTLPQPHDLNNTLRDGVSSGIRLLVYGGTGLIYTRLAWTERPTTRRDPARDLTLYVLSAFALVFLTLGVTNALALIVDELLGFNAQVLLGSTPGSALTSWAEVAAWILSGGLTWAAVSSVERRYPGVRDFRIPYLYIVLAVSIGVTLGSGGTLTYELLRRAFGYMPDSIWQFLHDALPPFLVAGTVWIYHWRMLWRQWELDRLSASDAKIPWPRRPYLATLSFVGTALTASGAVLVLWVAVDLVFKQHTLTGSGWWRDETSAGITLLVIGAGIWLRAWATLQAAAAVDARERAAESRRRLLGAIVAIGALCGTGFTIAFLWLTFRMILGGPHDATTISDTLRYLATALVTIGLIAYHGPILRDNLRSGVGGAARMRVVALIAPEAEGAVAELSRRLGRRIEVIGYLSSGDVEGNADVQSLAAALASLADSGATRALLVMGADGGVIYPYSRNAAGAFEAANRSSDLQVAPEGL
jgi:hypothetical protein